MLAVAFAIAEKYGRWRLTLAETAQELGCAESTVRNKISRGELNFIYKDGATLFADARDVASYLDSKRAKQEQAPALRS